MLEPSEPKRRKRKQASPPSAADPTTSYATRVCGGEIIAGPHVRDACARHLKDLEEGPRRRLVWDPAEAARSFKFYREILRLNGGEFEGKPFVLHESQEFIVGSLWGWKREDGYRRFRVAFIEEAKGNGKSPLIAGMGLIGLVADGEPRAEIYAAATKKDQAQILFRDAVAMVEQSPELDAALVRSGGKGHEWNIADLSTGSFFRTVASDDAQSGPRPHIALLDEIHEHKTGLMVEMMRAGTKGRRQALIVMITNSGVDRNSVCRQYHDYATKVASGTLLDDGFFGYVCALDEGDEPFESEECWGKVNPLLGVSIQPSYLREQITEARGMPSKESTVRRLNFCQWVEAFNPWLPPEIWFAVAETYDPALLEGRRCHGGLDLSSTTDLTAFVLLFEPTAEDPFWRQRCWFWLPADALHEKERKDGAPYGRWRAEGFLETTPGAAINKTFVLARIVDCAARYQILSIGYDLYRIEDIKTLANESGIVLPLVAFGQGYKSMAPAVDEYERMLVSRELRHDNNQLMNWNVGSVEIESDPAGNRKLNKAKSTGRIDGAVAAVMAAGRTLAAKEEQPSYELHFV